MTAGTSSPSFFDTHCHLDLCEPGALDAAAAVGVDRIVVPAIGRDGWDAVAALGADARIGVALGVHPQAPGDLEGLADAIARAGAVAVGEIGLDRRLPEWERQLALFREQMALAGALNLPLLVHCVRAHDVLAVELRDAKPRVPIVLHAYSGSADLVPVYDKLGCYFSFAGSVTWEGGKRVPRACAAVPEHRLLIETDAPYLAPEPHRGSPNAPRLLPSIAAAIARIRGVTVERIAQITTANAERVFSF